MKTFDEIIRERRSVRNYDATREVPRAVVEQLIAAATEAPSWKNQQTSRYHVVASAEMRERLKACLLSHNPMTVKDASVLVVATFVKDVVGFNADGTPTNEIGNGWGIYDLGLHNALLLLKATDLGLDTIVLGLRDADAIRHLLNIPDDEVIVSVIGIGYRTQDAARPPRKAVGDIARFY